MNNTLELLLMIYNYQLKTVNIGFFGFNCPEKSKGGQSPGVTMRLFFISTCICNTLLLHKNIEDAIV